VNGDGIGDLVVGAPGIDKVFVISGKDQSVLRTIGDPDGVSGDQFGFSVIDVGDWDGDSVDDFAVGAPGAPAVVPLPCLQPPCKPDPQWGRVFVISGATGAVIKKFTPPELTLQFGYAIALLGDVNADGKPDLAIGAPVLTNALGSVYALSGTDGSQIWKAAESGAGASLKQAIASFGATLAVLRDINGDGKADLVIGAPFHDDGSGKLGGAAYVLSGVDGTQIRSHSVPQVGTDDRFGVSVANVTDQNGDGKDDYLVGDSKASKAFLFSGADGSFLGAVASRQLDDSFGFGASTVSDYDGDRKNDFFIAAPDADRVYLMNSSGTQLLQVPDPAAGNKSFGHALSATRDLGGDKGLDLLVGAPGEVGGSGAAYLITIRENKAPVAKAGSDQTVECDRGATVTLDGSASFDPDKDPITFAWKQVSGTTVNLNVSGAIASFSAAPPGVYEFQLTVTDDKGASSTDNVIVTIRDSTSPVLILGLSPNTLWPPNHKMVDITANIVVRDACDANPSVKLTSITSSEPANGTGDGNTSPDIAAATFGTDDRNFQLRAERKGNGSGRVYTVVYEAQDASGNKTDKSSTVIVLHNSAGVADSILSFAASPVGTASSAQTVTVSNPGPDPLLVASIVLSGVNLSDFSTTNNCGPTVSSGSTCSIDVVFKPSSVGNRSASLMITDDAANSPQMITLMGAGIAAAADYVVAASPTFATIKQGQSATFTLTVTPTSGFNQPVSFACTGLPAGASCLFSPASITPSGGPVGTVLTVTTTAPSVRSGLSAPAFDWLWMRGGYFAAASFFVPGIRRKRLSSRRKLFAGLMILVIAVTLSIGCGVGSRSLPLDSAIAATPLGTSQVAVSASAGSPVGAAQHGTSISITITQ